MKLPLCIKRKKKNPSLPIPVDFSSYKSTLHHLEGKSYFKFGKHCIKEQYDPTSYKKQYILIMLITMLKRQQTFELPWRNICNVFYLLRKNAALAQQTMFFILFEDMRK